MTLVKVCGIRTVEEGLVALDAGADWLGFVLWPRSKRAIEPAQAAWVIRQLRNQRHWDWSAVGVFVDPSPNEAQDAARLCDLDYVQLSGDETAPLIAQMPLPAVKALHVRRGEEAAAAAVIADDHLGAQTYLLDTHADGHYGGTGSPFDWQALRQVGPRCIVAGGLSPSNVSGALELLSPLGVDVSSGVEFPSGGKDPSLVRAFLEAVKQHDATLTPRG
jgi:phosphoribosylanthranilate isomerase